MEGAVCVVFGVCVVGWGVGGECGEFLSYVYSWDLGYGNGLLTWVVDGYGS